MNKTLASALMVFAMLSSLIFSTAPAFAVTGSDTSCTVTVEQVTTPLVPAVYETVIVPAVTVIEYEFVHENAEKNNQDPRWERAGWNADSNPKSTGWYSTGLTRTHVVTEATTKQVLVTAEIPATTKNVEVMECVDVLPPIDETVVTPPTATTPETKPVVPTVSTPVGAYPAPEVTPNTMNGVVPESANPTPVPEAPATKAPTELANTGANDNLYIWGAVGLLALIAGIASIIHARRKA